MCARAGRRPRGRAHTKFVLRCAAVGLAQLGERQVGGPDEKTRGGGARQAAAAVTAAMRRAPPSPSWPELESHLGRGDSTSSSLCKPDGEGTTGTADLQ